MTVAALEAVVLRDCLRRGDRDLSSWFFRAAAKPIGTAWQLARGADLAPPGVPGRRPVSVRLMNRYIDRVLTAAMAKRRRRDDRVTLSAPDANVRPTPVMQAKEFQ